MKLPELPKGKSWTAPDTEIFTVPGHLGQWLTDTLHRQYKERIIAKSKGYGSWTP